MTTPLQMGLVNAEVGSVLEACFAGRNSLNLCGGNAACYAAVLEALLSLAPGEHALVLLASDVAFTAPHQTVVPLHDSAVSGLDFARSALRQDPDILAIDDRSASALEMLINAKLTGHRLLTHFCQPVEEACSLYSAAVAAVLPADYAPGYHQYDLFLQLGDGPSPEILEVWQAGLEPDGQQGLARLFHRDSNGWQTGEESFARPEPPAPQVQDSTPLELPSDWPQRTETLLSELRRELGPHRRVAWGPSLGEPPLSHERSHFGGLPQLPEGDRWPCCGACSQRMFLVLQVELALAPEPFREALGASSGLFQLFYCVSDRCSVPEAWAPFSANSLARVITEPYADPAEADSLSTPEAQRFGSASIASWTMLEEGPSYEERSLLWPSWQQLDGSWVEALSDIARRVPESDHLKSRYGNYLDYFQILEEETVEVASYLVTAPGDKLLGWPFWSQGVEYPCCPDCQQPMTMVVQINNDGFGAAEPGHGSFLGQLFAGDGNGHVFRCAEHGKLTFAWACG